jgi:hypothetical protein
LTPPWRSQDIPDALLGRETHEHRALPFDSDDGFEDVLLDLLADADEGYLIWQPRNAVIWPMITHRHDNSCGRG